MNLDLECLDLYNWIVVRTARSPETPLTMSGPSSLNNESKQHASSSVPSSLSCFGKDTSFATACLNLVSKIEMVRSEHIFEPIMMHNFLLSSVLDAIKYG